MAYVINQNTGTAVYASFMPPSGSYTPSDGGGQQYEYEFEGIEETLKNDAVVRINHIVKNIVGSNNKNTTMIFGFTGDVHTMFTADDERVPEDLSSIWPTSDEYYYGNNAEGAIKVLGAICHEVKADAVFCNGDLSAGNLPFECYDFMLEYVKDIFHKYISVPCFTVEGNHDRWYEKHVSVGCRSNADWLTYLKKFNKPSSSAIVTYIDEDGTADPLNDGKPNGYSGNTYYVDFPKYKIRAVMTSNYEKQEKNGAASDVGSGPFFTNLFAAFSFPESERVSSGDGYIIPWTIISVTHNIVPRTNNIYTWYMNGSAPGSGAGTDYHDYTKTKLNGGAKGLSVVGSLCGHYHNRAYALFTSGSNVGMLEMIRPGASTMKPDPTKAERYRFSVFILDTKNFKLYEVRVGNQEDTNVAAFRSDSSVSSYGWFEYDIRHNDYNN